MPPCVSCNNGMNRVLINAESSGEKSARRSIFVESSYFHNGFVGKLCSDGLLALSVSNSPTFFDHISRVLFHCPKKQMVRIAAGRIVALMQNFHAFWNFSMRENPRNSVGLCEFSIPRSMAVSVAVSALHPLPASVRRSFFDRVPEVFNRVAPPRQNSLCNSLRAVKFKHERRVTRCDSLRKDVIWP